MSDLLHEAVHRGIEQAPDPVIGVVGGAACGTVVGAVAAVGAIKATGVTVGVVVASVKVLGVAATASALGSMAAPFVIPAVLTCAAFGLGQGLKNWLQKKGL